MREDQKTWLSSPLIQISEEHGSGCNHENGEKGNRRRRRRRKEVSEEVKRQLWLAGPLISVNLLLFSLQIISVMFVGHLGQLALSGASMATSFASVTGFSLLVSFSKLRSSSISNWFVRNLFLKLGKNFVCFYSCFNFI